MVHDGSRSVAIALNETSYGCAATSWRSCRLVLVARHVTGVVFYRWVWAWNGHVDVLWEALEIHIWSPQKFDARANDEGVDRVDRVKKLPCLWSSSWAHRVSWTDAS